MGMQEADMGVQAAKLVLAAVLMAASAAAATPCVECHEGVTPAIVSDWQQSKHSQNDVDCSACHGDAHMSAADADKATIPTPETCAACHEKQVTQFKGGKHAAAWAAMQAMPTAHWQPMAMMEGMKGCGGCDKIGLKTETDIQGLKKNGAGFGMASCDACHTRHLFSVQEAKQPQACPTASVVGWNLLTSWNTIACQRVAVRLESRLSSTTV